MVTEPAIKSPLIHQTAFAEREQRPARRGARPTVVRWLLGAVAVVAIAVALVVASGMRPGYDAFGWLVWGRQVLHWNLNTDGAPSWKPLTFVFTLPYALTGATVQMWLWMVTAVAGALAGCVFAARIVYWLTGPCPQRPYAPLVAGAFAGVGVLALDTYSHLILIASSDPLIVTLCLAAIDCHLCRRYELAFGMLVLASLGRPEAWAFTILYALWAWRSVPSMRLLTVLGIALIPVAWFTVPALTSKSWFTAGNLALHSVNPVNVIHGSKILGVINRFRDLNAVPVQIAALVGVLIAAVRRDRATLVLAAAGCLWVALEIGLALRGWSAANRYVLEPAAVVVVLTGYAVGRVLALAPRPARDRGALRWATAAVTVILIAGFAVVLVPRVRHEARAAHSELTEAKFAGKQIVRLQAVVARDGGAARIRGCGQPVSFVGLQSKVAWATGLNVGDVGFRPGQSIDSGQPIVFFKPYLGGWEVRPIHMRAADAATCDRLRIDSAF